MAHGTHARKREYQLHVDGKNHQKKLKAWLLAQTAERAACREAPAATTQRGVAEGDCAEGDDAVVEGGVDESSRKRGRKERGGRNRRGGNERRIRKRLRETNPEAFEKLQIRDTVRSLVGRVEQAFEMREILDIVRSLVGRVERSVLADSLAVS